MLNAERGLSNERLKTFGLEVSLGHHLLSDAILESLSDVARSGESGHGVNRKERESPPLRKNIYEKGGFANPLGKSISDAHSTVASDVVPGD